MAKKVVASAQLTSRMKQDQLWVAVFYADDTCDLIPCSGYSQARALLSQVSPLYRHLGALGGLPDRRVAHGISRVELYDSEARMLWTSEYWQGVGLGLPADQWRAGKFVWDTDLDRLVPFALKAGSQGAVAPTSRASAHPLSNSRSGDGCSLTAFLRGSNT